MVQVTFKKANQKTYNLKDNSKFMVISCKKDETDYIDENGEALSVYRIGAKPIDNQKLADECKTKSEYPYFLVYRKPLELRATFSIVANDKNGYSVSNSFVDGVDASLLD